MINGSAMISPCQPWGMKPPWLHRLLTAACGGVLGPKMNQLPIAIIITTAPTLMIANQNSDSP
ncbi:hypothetical protein D3C75_1283360 [compost metagenome]